MKPGDHSRGSTSLHALAQVRGLVVDGVLSIPQGRPSPLEAFAEAVTLAEAPAHGTKPLFVFDEGRDERDSYEAP